MKKTSIILILVSTLFASTSAQDTLFLKNEKSVVVDVISIEENLINYKKINTKEGTAFSIPVSQVEKIKYRSGNEQFFQIGSDGSPVIEASTEENDKGVSEEKNTTLDQEEPEPKSFRMKLGLGLMVGANFSTIKYNYNNEPINLYNTYRFSPAGGLFIEWEIARFLSLRTSFYYKDNGDRTNGDTYVSKWEFPQDNPIVYSAEGDGFIDKHLGYVEWSILPLFGYTNKDNSLQIQFGGGVYAAYGITGKEKIDLYIDYYRNGEFDETEQVLTSNPVVFVRDLIIEEKIPETLYYNQLDYGFTFYLGVKPRPFNIGASFTWGKANILSTSIEELFYSGEFIQTATNYSFALMFGYYL